MAVNSLRMKLTVWNGGVLLLMLLLFSVGVYFLISYKFRARFDAQIVQTIDSIADFIRHEKGEKEPIEIAIKSLLADFDFPQDTVSIFDGSGRRLMEKPADSGLHFLDGAYTLENDGVLFQTFHESAAGTRRDRRVALKRYDWSEGHPLYIVAGRPLHEIQGDLNIIGGSLLLAVPLTLLLAGWGGWLLVRKNLAPIRLMSDSAQKIGAENLSERLPVANPRDELGRLAASFNDLLVRLKSAFDQQRQFMADASHELRTPLSVLRTTTEVMLEQSHRSETEYREALSMIDSQTSRLARIVEDMFIIARADAGHRPLEWTDFYLDELIDESIKAARILAARKNIAIEMNGTFEAPYTGDEGLLRQMLLNLLDNAIKHTPEGGFVRVSLARSESNYEILVADTGAGVPIEDQPRIFERFYRADKSRVRRNGTNGGGAGLGLPIARWIAEAHQGKLELVDSKPGGSVFWISLRLGGNLSKS